ncbi:four helix bundle protein [Anabaena sp. FACHB-1391]|uniref:four helix bundle protein n=1 Tax=Anabaena sp. FACHB-1391 TaxID=2692771 RepID=UPI001680A4E0|nr:four helix bundle protein [Anabaena sp. FACHB-1391]
MDKEEEPRKIKTHEDLGIYQKAFNAAMTIFDLSKQFPAEERYSLTDIRRSSRSVCANFAEAWRKRRYKASFIAKLNDCESEAAETQVWLKFAVKCQYISVEEGRDLYSTYNQVLSGLVKMINHPESWLIGNN